MRERDSLAGRQNTWSQAVSLGLFAHHPVQVPAVGNALQFVFTGVSDVRPPGPLTSCGELCRHVTISFPSSGGSMC